MKKKEILKSYKIDKLDDQTLFISNSHFQFSYTKADDIVKQEYKGLYKYFGGLQCNYSEDTENYKNLETWLIELADKILN